MSCVRSGDPAGTRLCSGPQDVRAPALHAGQENYKRHESKTRELLDIPLQTHKSALFVLHLGPRRGARSRAIFEEHQTELTLTRGAAKNSAQISRNERSLARGLARCDDIAGQRFRSLCLTVRDETRKRTLELD